MIAEITNTGDTWPKQITKTLVLEINNSDDLEFINDETFTDELKLVCDDNDVKLISLT